MDLVRRAFGALPDAAWLRRQFTADAEVVHDLRHGVRMLRKSPTFTAAAVVTLALGIGGTVAIATLLDTLSSVPFRTPMPNALSRCGSGHPTGEREDVAPANFLDWRERSRSFEQVAAAIPYSYDYTGGGEPEVFFGAQVTEGFWDALGVRPALGRFFRPGEHARGGQPVAIITHALWQRRFGGDPGIVNSAISLDGALMDRGRRAARGLQTATAAAARGALGLDTEADSGSREARPRQRVVERCRPVETRGFAG